MRDGDGWIVWGSSKMWSLGPDGSGREELLTLGADGGFSARDDYYELHTEPDAVYALIEPADTSVRRAVLVRIDRASKAVTTLHTWRRTPTEPREQKRVELAAVTASHFVLIDRDEIVRVAKSGGPPEPIARCACSAVGADATYLYWYQRENGLRLGRVRVDGPAIVEQLFSLEGLFQAAPGIWPGLVVTGEAFWLTKVEGALPLREPWLARLPKP